MDLFIKTTAGIFFALILFLTLSKQAKDMATVLSIGACCMVGLIAFYYFQPVLSFLHTLQEKTGVDNAFFQILLKAVGIALLGEVACSICSDAGNSSLAKVLQVLSSAVILWLSLPLLEKLLDLVDGVLDFR
jgi:stage III sporulation protein AD